jgi:hypothetical protein
MSWLGRAGTRMTGTTLRRKLAISLLYLPLHGSAESDGAHSCISHPDSLRGQACDGSGVYLQRFNCFAFAHPPHLSPFSHGGCRDTHPPFSQHTATCRAGANPIKLLERSHHRNQGSDGPEHPRTAKESRQDPANRAQPQGRCTDRDQPDVPSGRLNTDPEIRESSSSL